MLDRCGRGCGSGGIQGRSLRVGDRCVLLLLGLLGLLMLYYWKVMMGGWWSGRLGPVFLREGFCMGGGGRKGIGLEVHIPLIHKTVLKIVWNWFPDLSCMEGVLRYELLWCFVRLNADCDST